MKDQLALYGLSSQALEGLAAADLISDSEVPGYLERKGRFYGDLFLDGKSAGEILRALTTIMGAPIDGLVGRSGMSMEPSGPVVFTSHIEKGNLELIIKALSQAIRILGGSVAAGEEERADRLTKLAGDPGVDALQRAVLQVRRFAESARGVDGKIIVVYTCW